ncbi:MAG: hypothetical protein N3A38_15930, partial [Planctomycetota bacterium]|nr:hypothetical protein [Planctomycetota bacterium]
MDNGTESGNRGESGAGGGGCPGKESQGASAAPVSIGGAAGAAVGSGSGNVGDPGGGSPRTLRIGWPAFAVAMVLCVAQAFATLLACNYFQVYPTSTLIPILTFAVFFFLLFIVNPLLKRIHPRLPLNGAELVAIFASMAVTSGISTYGLVEQLVPIMAAPFNPDWNIPQRGWDRDVNPHLNPRLYFGGEAVDAGIRIETAIAPFDPGSPAGQAVARALAAGKPPDADVEALLSGRAPFRESEVREAVESARRTIGAEADWMRYQSKRCLERAAEAERLSAGAGRRAIEIWERAAGGRTDGGDGPGEYLRRADEWRKGVQDWAREADAIVAASCEVEVARRAMLISMAPVVAEAEKAARVIAEATMKREAADKLRAASGDRELKAAGLDALAAALDDRAVSAAMAAARRKLEAMAAELRARAEACEKLAAEKAGKMDEGGAQEAEARRFVEAAGICRSSAARCESLASALPAGPPDGEALKKLTEAASTCRRIGADKVLAFRQGVERDQSLLRDVPWLDWARPVGYWLIFIAGIYGIFYFLSSVLYDYWAHREKLIFPLARLPLELLPKSGNGAIPEIVKTPLFWVGFLLAFLPLTWNVAVSAGHIRGLGPI